MKNDDVDDKMVCDATDVYDKEALVTKLAENHKARNCNDNLTVS